MENLNGVQAIIDLVKEKERLQTAVDDLVFYIIGLESGKEVLVRNHDDLSISIIFDKIRSLTKGMDKHNFSPKLPLKPSLTIKDIRKKLSDMRITKKQIDAAKDQEELCGYYGYTDCINDIIDWLNEVEKKGTIAKSPKIGVPMYYFQNTIVSENEKQRNK